MVMLLSTYASVSSWYTSSLSRDYVTLLCRWLLYATGSLTFVVTDSISTWWTNSHMDPSSGKILKRGRRRQQPRKQMTRIQQSRVLPHYCTDFAISHLDQKCQTLTNNQPKNQLQCLRQPCVEGVTLRYMVVEGKFCLRLLVVEGGGGRRRGGATHR